MSKKLTGIGGGCILVAIVVVIATAGGSAPPSAVNAAPPHFLQAGEVYEAMTAADAYGARDLCFKVLEIADDGWIVAVMRQDAPEEYRYTAWLNTSQLILVWQGTE